MNVQIMDSSGSVAMVRDLVIEMPGFHIICDDEGQRIILLANRKPSNATAARNIRRILREFGIEIKGSLTGVDVLDFTSVFGEELKAAKLVYVDMVEPINVSRVIWRSQG